jgi:hypothetical protein
MGDEQGGGAARMRGWSGGEQGAVRADVRMEW